MSLQNVQGSKVPGNILLNPTAPQSQPIPSGRTFEEALKLCGNPFANSSQLAALLWHGILKKNRVNSRTCFAGKNGGATLQKDLRFYEEYLLTNAFKDVCTHLNDNSAYTKIIDKFGEFEIKFQDIGLMLNGIKNISSNELERFENNFFSQLEANFTLDLCNVIREIASLFICGMVIKESIAKSKQGKTTNEKMVIAEHFVIRQLLRDYSDFMDELKAGVNNGTYPYTCLNSDSLLDYLNAELKYFKTCFTEMDRFIVLCGYGLSENPNSDAFLKNTLRKTTTNLNFWKHLIAYTDNSPIDTIAKCISPQKETSGKMGDFFGKLSQSRMVKLGQYAEEFNKFMVKKSERDITPLRQSNRLLYCLYDVHQLNVTRAGPNVLISRGWRNSFLNELNGGKFSIDGIATFSSSWGVATIAS
ncbi:MAG: hypothetical protein LBI69_02900 [Puniceicoccales bacterium]|jgi:hypothetical protein|nr:hypothetical protein [Puniceicoccales bacterium]